MKGLSKLCPLICSLAIILVTMVTAIGVFPLPSVAETQSEVITDIATYTDTEINQYNNESWGMPQGMRSRITVGGKAYLKYENERAYGKARLPVFAEKNQNWSGYSYVEFPVINNSEESNAPLLPFFVLSNPSFILKNDSPLKIMGTQSGQTEELVREQGYIIIPKGFNGIVRMPVSSDATQYGILEGEGSWSLSNITQMGFYFNDQVSVNVSIGNITLVKDVPTPPTSTESSAVSTTTTTEETTTQSTQTSASGSTAATSTVETTPSLKSGPITNIADMTEAQIKEYTGVAWGLPKGDRSRVQVDGKAYLRYVNAAGVYGKARLPMLSEDKRDWSKVTYIEIPVINNSNSKGAPILPFFHVDDNTYYCVSQGAGVLITGNQNGETIAIEMDKDYMVIPAGFKGTIRIPMSAIESHYTAIEGTTPWSLKNIQQIGFFFNDWGQVDISIGDISVFVSGGDGESVNTGYGLNMLPVFIALIAASVVLVFVKRYRKICG